MPSMIRLLASLLLLLCISPNLPARSLPPLLLEDSSAIFSAADHIEFLEDPGRQLGLLDVSSASWDKRFTAMSKSGFGRSRSAFWVRFQVADHSQQKWYLLLEAMLKDEFDLYIFPVGQAEQAGEAMEAMTARYATLLPDHRRRAWSLNLPAAETLQVYMRVTNGDSLIAVPVEFLNSDAMLARSTGAYRLGSAIYAGMITLALYQLFMFLILRERTYLFLALSMLTMTLVTHRTNPVFDDLNVFHDTGDYFFSAPILLLLFSVAAFAREMLETKKKAPTIDFIFKLFMGIALGMIFIVGLLPGGPMYPLALGIIILLFTQISGFYVAYFKNGGVVAKYFAWIYLIPTALQIPNLVILVFDVEHWLMQRNLVPAFATLLWMLFLALLQAKRVSLLRDDIRRTVNANAAKDEFIAVMNHELRTPMNAMVGLSNLLKLENLSSAQHNYVERLSIAARHMMHLIDNILDYSKVGQAQFNLKHKSFRLDIALQSVYHLLLQQANQKGLELVLDNKAEKMLVITGDRSKLAQILINLLGNSIKYTPGGKIKLCVTQRVGSTPDRVRLHFSILDTGPGISPHQHKKLFDPFIQLDTVTSQPEGIGLGLPISKKLVEHMGGSLQIKSQPGQGSEFFFEVELPRGEVADTETAVAGLRDMPESPQLRFPEGVHILLVDDFELNRIVATAMLQSMGAEVSQADSGKNAILQLQRYSYDLMLLDVSMADLDGLEVARRVRGQYNLKLPIIALTAHVSAGMKQQCLEAGMDDFIGKPFEYQELYAAINRQLSKIT